MQNNYKSGRSNALAQNGMAATSNPLSSNEAISILKKGGNAVDAAIGAAAVQAVVEPGSTGIGGDCFAIIAMNNKKPISINGSGIAPKKATYDYFKKNKIGNIDLTSPHSVTIPGCVDAWHSMHKKFGKLDFQELFLTAIKYAKEGFPVYEIESKTWNENILKLKKFKTTKEIFLNKGKAPKFGDIFKNTSLANTLKFISQKGSKGFYASKITKDMVSTLNQYGGLHTEEDFLKQKTIFSNTILNNYKNYNIHQCPLNGPGIIVLMMMKIIEKFDFKKIEPLSFERYHIQSEITKRCYEIKETLLGDPKFSKININKILSNLFIENIFKKISLNKVYNTTKSYVTSHPETIYLSVVDRDLNSVSLINSICHAFGSGITTKSGILFQNRGVNFRLEKNHPNVIDSYKKPLHTIIPGLLTDKKNNAIFSYGVMGGQYQPIGQSQILQNIYDFNMNIQEAIEFPRAFSLNGDLMLEKNIPESIFKKLKKIGHNVKYIKNSIGGGQGILIDRKRGLLIGGSDPRKDGLAIGY